MSPVTHSYRVGRKDKQPLPDGNTARNFRTLREALAYQRELAMADREGVLVGDYYLYLPEGVSAETVELIQKVLCDSTSAWSITGVRYHHMGVGDPHDVVVDGTYKPEGHKGEGYRFSAWLPLLAIRERINWCAPEVARMTDHPEMTQAGDWSGVRDTDRERILEIFEAHVRPILPRSNDGG